MGEALTGAALLIGEAALGLGLAGLGAWLTIAARRRNRWRRQAIAASWQATKQNQQAGQAWALAWRANARLANLEDRVAALEAGHHDATTVEHPSEGARP